MQTPPEELFSVRIVSTDGNRETVPYLVNQVVSDGEFIHLNLVSPDGQIQHMGSYRWALVKSWTRV